NRDEVMKRIEALLNRKRHQQSPVEQIPRSAFEAILVDRATGLPTVPMVLDRVKEQIIEQGEIGIVFVDIEQFESIEAEYGWAFFDEFLRRVCEAVVDEAETRFSRSIVAAQRVSGSSFYAFFETRGHDLSQENAFDN